MDSEEVTLLEEDVLDNEDRKILHIFKGPGIPTTLGRTLMYISAYEDDKKKKKHLFDIFTEEDDIEKEQYQESIYDISRYPPESIPPTVNGKHSLNPEYMMYNPNV